MHRAPFPWEASYAAWEALRASTHATNGAHVAMPGGSYGVGKPVDIRGTRDSYADQLHRNSEGRLSRERCEIIATNVAARFTRRKHEGDR